MNISKEQFKDDYQKAFTNMYASTLEGGSSTQQYTALGTLLRSYVAEYWRDERERYIKEGQKQVFYFSIEFLPGKFLENNANNMDILDIVEEGCKELGLDFDEITAAEAEPAIGNGGLGRLASCYMDAGASLGYPLHGNGIRYRHGLFRQKIVDGYQAELPDNWLRHRNAWEVRDHKSSVLVRFGGNVYLDGFHPVYEDTDDVVAVAYDIPMIGYHLSTVNTMRLWSAEVPPEEEEEGLASKEKYEAVDEITEFLYPDDSSYEGKLLRLKQEYFFVSAGIQTIMKSFKRYQISPKDLSEKIAIHINDTHPALAIPELMRILLDEEKLTWDQAWEITINTCAYTNHTVLREAMETWRCDMVKKLIPRIYMIIEEIDRRYVEQNKPIYGDELVQSTRPIQDDYLHMAHLAIIGSHSVNGVAGLHSKILSEDVLRDFSEMTPHKFNNKTNGISQRRYLHVANPELRELISECIGEDWLTNPASMKVLLAYQNDQSVLSKLADIKHQNKEKLAQYIKENNGIEVNTDAIFDVLIKRLHAYKRQHLQLLHIIHLYFYLKDNPQADFQPRVFIFGAKAAPSYVFAKDVIKVINEVAETINNDPDCKDKLQVVFIENYGAALAELIIPAAEISEQISLAGKEASGTGNMKMMLNGALTMGTLDGANVEINSFVGDENMFVFGLRKEEVDRYNERASYNSKDLYKSDAKIKRVVDSLVDGTFPRIQIEGQTIYDHLITHNDEYYALKDFHSFVEAQEKAAKLYKNKDEWNKKSLINIANSGPFSADYAVQRYASEIWIAQPKAMRTDKSIVTSHDEPM
ncbi:MAG: glycogen/starch/alpha-glucan phosphorylase [Atopococcus tabaci]|uniref:Alpha-1,4 glucan phosphorylase n=1 Tax=Atopococcus tabaci TaxID=269774 RepID=A0AA43UCP9_9LACT|nr:glycogen/starch/alpha-glucan phosphorylase [Atopococcus tabaci]